MKTLFTIAALMILCSWQRPASHGRQQADWLTGGWVYQSARGPVYECWKAVNDTAWAGKSFMLKNGDTVTLENIRLISEKGTLHYIPTVGQQNLGLPVRFTATVIDPYKLVFENPAHDFPQRISYTLIHRDSLLAEISGTRNGSTQRRLFPMQRAKE